MKAPRNGSSAASMQAPVLAVERTGLRQRIAEGMDDARAGNVPRQAHAQHVGVVLGQDSARAIAKADQPP
jgi:hypothetical protein